MNGRPGPPRAEAEGAVFRPGTIGELSRVAASLRESGEAVSLRGSGEGPCWRDALLAPLRSIVLADLAAEPQIEPLDLVASAEAGTPLDRLREAVRSRGLDLPLEGPPWTAATLGGLLARGEGKGSQIGPAGPRAVVLGMEAVLPDGRIVRVGGRTVKNVAGYDLHRLFVGSLGTLGAIGRVHLKLVPLPAAAARMRLRGDLRSLLGRAEQLLLELPQVRSVAIEGVVECGLAADLAVSFSGPRGRVASMRDRLLGIDRRFEEAAEAAAPVGRAPLARATVRRDALADLATRWVDLLRAAGSTGRLRIHPDAGECWLLIDEPSAASLREGLRRCCRDAGGAYFEARWPAGRGGSPWDPVPAGLGLWKKLRRVLDPDDLWNPGVLP